MFFLLRQKNQIADNFDITRVPKMAHRYERLIPIKRNQSPPCLVPNPYGDKPLKIALIGSLGVGKTCFLESYSGNHVPLEHSPTFFDISKFDVKVPDDLRENSVVIQPVQVFEAYMKFQETPLYTTLLHWG